MRELGQMLAQVRAVLAMRELSQLLAEQTQAYRLDAPPALRASLLHQAKAFAPIVPLEHFPQQASLDVLNALLARLLPRQGNLPVVVVRRIPIRQQLAP